MLLMRWAIPLGYFQESGSGLTLLISGEAGKLETAERPDPGSPQVGQDQQDGSAAESGEQRDAHPAPAALPRTVTQVRTTARRGTYFSGTLPAGSSHNTRGTRTQPFLRSRAYTGV